MSKVHDFRSSMASVKGHEKTYLKFLQAQYKEEKAKVGRAKLTDEKQKGIDYVVNLPDGRTITYELKCDFYTAKTKNAVSEVDVVTPAPHDLLLTRTALGWTKKSVTDFLTYWVLGEAAYVFKWTDQMRDKWLMCGENHGTVKNIRNRRHYSVCHMFPFAMVRGDAILVIPERDIKAYE